MQTFRSKALMLATLALASVAAAITTPSAVAASKGERKVEGSITLTLTPPSESLPITDKINLFVPERFRSAGAKLPHCSQATLEGDGPKACPRSSIVGNGTALGYTILGGQFVIEHLTLTIYNGQGGILLTWVQGLSPVVIETAVPGLVGKPAGFGQELSFTIPHGLLEPLPGAPGWLQTLNARLFGRVGWLRTRSCPPHPWSLKAELGYTNGQGLALQARLACV
jgi:hypothetical protein